MYAKTLKSFAVSATSTNYLHGCFSYVRILQQILFDSIKS